jgi:hypothetical protein
MISLVMGERTMNYCFLLVEKRWSHHLSVHGRAEFSFQLNLLDRVGFFPQIIHDFYVGLENTKYLTKQAQ